MSQMRLPLEYLVRAPQELPRVQVESVGQAKRSPQSIEDRFWEKVDRLNTPDGCWLWIGALYRKGYGSFFRIDGSCYAHRVGYEIQVGPIPTGLVVCHRCDNPPCVRGSHLFVGTQADNVADMAAKGRTPRGEARGSAKLTSAQVLDIRRMSLSGASQTELARVFEVARKTIGRIIRREKWSHV